MAAHTRIALFGMLSALGWRGKALRLKFARCAGIEIVSFTQLSEEQGQFLCEVAELCGPPEAGDGDYQLYE